MWCELLPPGDTSRGKRNRTTLLPPQESSRLPKRESSPSCLPQLWPHKRVCWTGIQPLGPPPESTQCGKLRTKTQTYEPLGNVLDPNYSKQTGDIQERIDERRRKEGKGEIEAGIRGGVKEAAESGRIITI